MFIKSNNEINYTASDIEVMKEIPSGNWLMKFDKLKLEYYLEGTAPFTFPEKLYGNPEKLSDRYLNTFNYKDGNVGILLSGSKGTGKSVLAKLTSHKSKLPIIIITEPFVDENFKSFLNNLKQKCVVLIDEFEKVYFEKELQDSFLSILDGVFEGKKLFIFTSNEKHRVNKYMINRPGRILYLEEYDSLDDSIIKDVIKDNLKNKKNKKDLQHVLNILANVTMDILISIISEMNLYNETATESIRYLNIKPEDSLYKVEVFQGKVRLGDNLIGIHPLANEKFEIDVLVDDISRYKHPVSNIHSGCSEDIPIPLCDTEKNNAHSNKNRSEWIYLTIDITKSKVIQQGKDVIIESDNNMRYKFTRKSTYSYLF